MALRNKPYAKQSKPAVQVGHSGTTSDTPIEDIDPNAMIAGFPPLSIKHALWDLVLHDGSDGTAKFAAALGCGLNQATDVLETLEKGGFIARIGKRKKWDLAPRGHHMVFYWKPPRRFTPAIEREEEPDVCGEIIESVPCSILRSGSDQSVVFEEAILDVGVSVDYEFERVIMVDLLQPDDYDSPDGSSRIEATIHLSIGAARKLREGLLLAIAHGQEELARRASVVAKRPEPPIPAQPKGKAKRGRDQKSAQSASTTLQSRASSTVSSEVPRPKTVEASDGNRAQSEVGVDRIKRKRRVRSVVNELRAKNRSQR